MRRHIWGSASIVGLVGLIGAGESLRTLFILRLSVCERMLRAIKDGTGPDRQPELQHVWKRMRKGRRLSILEYEYSYYS
jgi:hypothetical protein